jgi:D-lactate dehydrogenase
LCDKDDSAVVTSSKDEARLMKIAVFDTHAFDRQALQQANQDYNHDMVFLEPKLGPSTARLADGFPAVCSFVNDRVDSETLRVLKAHGTSLVLLRSAGFNHVDLEIARKLGMTVLRVPEYSPNAVAEHAVAMILTMNRKIHKSYNRVRELNFSLDGLVGFDLYGKTIGIVGTGRIGATLARIMNGFGCKILAFDLSQNAELTTKFGLQYVNLDDLLSKSDIISLHVPLTQQTRHLLDKKAFSKMKKGVMLVNTSRGGLIETPALIAALKTGAIGFAGLDVYEEEEGVFFQDLSESGLDDDVLARLLTFPNVLITSHQAFLTHEALANIAATTLGNASAFEAGRPLLNEVMWKPK